MKLSFTLTLFLASQLAFVAARPFLNGEVQVENADSLLEEASGVSAVAAEFNNATLPDQTGRLRHLKAALMPMFKSLPKNLHGKLELQVARYALHRLFEQQHSWSVSGLQPIRGTKHDNVFGELTADVSPTGISIDYLAMLATVLEDRMHKETVSQLKATFDTLLPGVADPELSTAELDILVDRYMTIYISGMREYNLTESELAEQSKYMETATKDWQETTEWIHIAQQDSMRARKACGHGVTDCTFDVQATTHVVEDLLKGYGQFNGGECKRLKHTLLNLEDRNSGRVSLADFYKEGLSGTWELNEKVDYLRDLGTLDESVPGTPRVIVANYVNSWVNCLKSSSLYSVCCRNECEDLMGHLERHIASPKASPERILQLVKTFDSGDLTTSVNISMMLHTRLKDIAGKHGGTVPLHGRLFAQWLHHVFPQSCPYPHTAGATNPLTPDQWMKETGHSAIKASHEEIMQAMNNVAVDVNGGVRGAIKVGDTDDEGSVPWSDVEEVFTVHIAKDLQQNTQFLSRDAMLMFGEAGVSLGLVFAMLRIAKAHRRVKTRHSPDYEKYTI